MFVNEFLLPSKNLGNGYKESCAYQAMVAKTF